jgi:glycosyltransferase involved in cell wall biosynthesis
LLMGDAADAGVTRLIAQLGIGAWVKIEPGLTRNEMRDRLQTLDVFVLPSYQEGLCIAALEAMACGVPVVSTRCGGPEEFVIPNVTGALVGFDEKEMAASVAAIIDSPGLRDKMSAAGREIVRRRYSNAHAQAVFAHAFDSTFPAMKTRLKERVRPGAFAELAGAAPP